MSDGQRPAAAGYRVVRALGTGARASVWVGHSDQPGEPATVALKVFRMADAASVAEEAAACEAVDSQHVVTLLDACSGEGHDVCLVLEWLGGGSLAALVRQRRRIRAGEAVTVLVSVLRGIRDLHTAGLAHNAISPTSVLFDQCGRPVLIALGHTTRLPPPYAADAAESRRGDWASYLAVVDLVLERVEYDERQTEVAHIRRCLEELMHAGDETEACDALEESLYVFAQPAPIVLHPTSIPSATHRSGEAAPSDLARAETTAVARRATRAGVGAQFMARTEAILDAGPVHSLKAVVAPLLQRRRKQLVFGAVLAGVVGVAGLAAIPPNADDATPAGAPLQRTASPAASHRASGRPTAPAEWSSPGGRVSKESRSSSAADPIAQDDPVSAVVALLRARSRCATARSIACLHLVDQDASPLLAADSAQLAEHKQLTVADGADASLVERTGNSALIELGPATATDEGPAPPTPDAGAARATSVLAIKGESGWRLREIFAN